MAHAPPMRNNGGLNCSDVCPAEILAQQEAQADSLAAEVLMSLGCSDSGGNGSDDSQAAVSSPPAPPQLQARPHREQRPQPEEARPAPAAPSTPPVEHKLIITPAWQVCFFPLLQGQSDRPHSCQVSASTVFVPGKLALACHPQCSHARSAVSRPDSDIWQHQHQHQHQQGQQRGAVEHHHPVDGPEAVNSAQRRPYGRRCRRRGCRSAAGRLPRTASPQGGQTASRRRRRRPPALRRLPTGCRSRCPSSCRRRSCCRRRCSSDSQQQQVRQVDLRRPLSTAADCSTRTHQCLAAASSLQELMRTYSGPHTSARLMLPASG